MSSANKERDIGNTHAFIDHLANMGFSGTLLVAFQNGAPTSISRKDDLDPDSLHAFLHRPRPVVARKKAPEKPADIPSPAEPGQPEKPEEAAPGVI